MAPAHGGQAAATADGSWMAWTVAGIGGIWVAVGLISLLAPDMVTGSEQQHMPVAAFSTWLWGLISTGTFLWGMDRLRGSSERQPLWIGLAVAVLVLWLVATVLAVATPRVETGSDPTRIPIGAVVAPIAATVLTTLAGMVSGVIARSPDRR